ncbi:MAG: restriction endonuclease subunit S, partial [Bacteroidota bacterium]
MTLTEMQRSDTICLGALATLRAGKTPSRADASMWRGAFPWASAKDLKSPRLDDTIEHVTTAATQAGSPLSKTGDSLVLVRGMTLLKRVPISRTTTPTSYNQDVCCVSARGGIDRDFLFVALLASAPRLADKVTKAGHGTGRISRESLESLPIRVPSRRIQQKIAKAYLAFERAIDALNAMIGQKRELKRGLMQELLTGRRRFESAGTPWKRLALEEVAEVRFSAVDKKSTEGEWPVRLCNYTDVAKNEEIISQMDFMRATATEKERASFGLRSGDIALTKDSETAEDIARTAFVRSTLPDLVLGYHLALVRVRDTAQVHPAFLNFALQSM